MHLASEKRVAASVGHISVVDFVTPASHEPAFGAKHGAARDNDSSTSTRIEIVICSSILTWRRVSMITCVISYGTANDGENRRASASATAAKSFRQTVGRVGVIKRVTGRAKQSANGCRDCYFGLILERVS